MNLVKLMETMPQQMCAVIKAKGSPMTFFNFWRSSVVVPINFLLFEHNFSWARDCSVSFPQWLIDQVRTE